MNALIALLITIVLFWMLYRATKNSLRSEFNDKYLKNNWRHKDAFDLEQYCLKYSDEQFQKCVNTFDNHKGVIDLILKELKLEAYTVPEQLAKPKELKLRKIAKK